MAQVCGGSNFDFGAQQKHDAAQRVIMRAADALAVHGPGAVDLDRLLAVLLRIYLARWSADGGNCKESRGLEEWCALAGTSSYVADWFAAYYPAVTDAVPLLRAELNCAAEQWQLGDSEQPPTAHALNALEHILFNHRLTRRPPSPRWPTTLRDGSRNALPADPRKPLRQSRQAD